MDIDANLTYHLQSEIQRKHRVYFILAPGVEFSVIDRDCIGSARFSQNRGLQEMLTAVLRRNAKTSGDNTRICMRASCAACFRGTTSFSV